ncbi:gliding motility protein GldL [Sphingobacterium multivorum]|uniref:type IX secretion system motor protein PorL/GldL n=1 Tax=Sphingobacterium multivorum TaxID=28454 RepID=UPI003DA45065
MLYTATSNQSLTNHQKYVQELDPLNLKILHIGGTTANYMIGIGLAVEAFLFFIMGFNPPPAEPDWTRVYPELDDNFTGLRDFNEKVSVMNKLSDVSLATEEFTNKLRTATSKFDNLSLAFEKASQNLVAISNTSGDTSNYHEQVKSLTTNLSQLNAMYERELRDSASHLQSMNKFYENLRFTMQNFNESLDDSKAFKDEVGKLAKNLNALNAIYGNMLSAMNQPRV